MKRVKVLLTIGQAEMLAQAAGQMEDDWSLKDSQTWREFESENSITGKDHDNFHLGLAKLWKAIHATKRENQK